MTNAQQTETATVHPFEAAGLGQAPFRFVGMIWQDLCYGEAILNREEYQRTGIRISTKPGGTCDYCGAYIVDMFKVESADGRTFKVGSDCIAKVEAKGSKVLTAVQRAARKAAKDRKLVRDKARIAAAAGLLPSVRNKIAESPHPTPYLANQGLTMADWCDWVLANGGTTGQLFVAKLIEKHAGVRS
jgi:hypothetical protein